MTEKRARYECLLSRLQASALIMFNVLISVFPHQSDIDRRTIGEISRDPNARRMFCSGLVERVKDIQTVVEAAVCSYRDFLGLPEMTGDTQVTASLALWKFLTRLLYEKPALLIEDKNGEHIRFIQDSLQQFLATQLQLQI